MEEILGVYARPAGPTRPLVCFDEGGKGLRAAARPPVPTTPGRPAWEDAEYVRRGTANLFLWCAPLLGERGGAVTERRTRVDQAHAVRDLVDIRFPEAAQIAPVLDNFNPHDPAALSAAFPPAETKRLWDKLEIHHTHGSWLNVAEIELSALGRQCLDRRFADQDELAAEVAAWAERRNAAHIRVA
ncbi:MAG: Mobile element protein [uncultured Thermomicrobiales bacterium]|uniref:Mobile element protein n=1 Tax=uncultured Thermomicrobiales bacterium TaxID=1645740 RepID=A0A6J4UKJ5_9BACT|nr:MAG: Mobile element protein [uncultured Thermomicrobiales bacterium]